MRLAALFLMSAGYLFGQVYTVSTVAGGGLPVNIPATSASIGNAGSHGYVAADRAGDLYFAVGFAVLRMDAATHMLSAVAGNGVPGFSGDGGPATAAQLSLPGYVAVDAAGNVYVADNCRIREISGGIINTIAGNGTCGTTGDGGAATSAAINPLGLAADPAGNVYLTNIVCTPSILFGGPIIGPLGSTVRKISGSTIVTIAGNGACTGTTTIGGPATGVALFDLGPIAADGAGNVYAAGDNLWKISGGTVTSIAAQSGITGLAADGSGNLFVSLPSSGIQEISNGMARNVVSVTGQVGIAVDSSDNLYMGLPDSYTIAEFSHGALTTVAGNGQFSYTGDGGPATSAQLYSPMALAWASGNLYLADQNSVIREVSNGIITTVPGTSGGVLSNAEGVAVDASGNLFIADFGNARIAELSQGVLSTLAPGYATDVALDQAGNVYAAGPSVLEISNGTVTTLASVSPQANALAVDYAGNVYFSNVALSRVYKIANGVTTTFAGTGYNGYSGDGGPATAATLTNPSGLAVDLLGNVYIADGTRIRKVSNGIITTIAGNGAQAYSSGENVPSLSVAIQPNRLAVDGAGDIYFTEQQAWRVRVLTPNPSTCSASVSPESANLGSAGGNAVFAVSIGPSCAWYVSNLPAWISYTGVGGVGPGSVPLAVAANTGAARSATIIIGEASVTVTQQAPATAAEVAPVAQFGSTVTTDSTSFGVVAMDGDLAVVGALGLLAPFFTGPEPGAIEIFARSAGTWNLDAVISDPAGEVPPGFGASVAVSGGTIVVCCSGPSGAVLAYTQVNGTWTPQTIQQGPEVRSVAIDGGTIVTGADPPNAAYIFTNSNGDWTQQATLTASGSGPNYGTTVAISGNTVLVDDPNRTDGTGAVYVFTGSGANWSQQGVLASADPNIGASIAISGDTALIGADDAGNNTGQVTIFTRSAGAWTQQAVLKAPDGASGDYFGRAVAIQDNILVAGSPAYNTSPVGAKVYVFQQNGVNWSELAEITPSDPNAGSFGASLAFSQGAVLTDAPSQVNLGDGAAYLYQLPLPVPINGASLEFGPISPGEIIALMTNQGPATGAIATLTNGQYPAQLGGVQVFFDGVPVPILYAQQEQINVQAPFDLANATTRIQVNYNGNLSWVNTVAVESAAPAIFHANASSQALAWNQDLTFNSASNPAAVGSTVAIWGTGGGAFLPAAITGGITPLAPLAQLALPVTVTLGGTPVPATVAYSGSAPTLSTGVFQVNFTIPAGAPTGANVPLGISIGGVAASNPPGGTTITIH
ncbi:MAG TPA: hypothetical protein VME43_33815 [Bryobacteraceae bacterium]|nr:hypothetical protein [Bryobacteraceae bacterium]